jgi:hypothetical protein
VNLKLLGWISTKAWIEKYLPLCSWWVKQEAKICAGGKAPHSSWRNYDDFNEFFWYLFESDNDLNSCMSDPILVF